MKMPHRSRPCIQNAISGYGDSLAVIRSAAMRCLSHPVSFLAMTVLALNDHWLKTATPSGLTGKLSDFAGLFFFPFLLIWLIAQISQRFLLWKAERSQNPSQPDPSTSWVPMFAFWGTGLWFALIKTIPFFNQMMIAIATFIADRPAAIVRDPSDLIALVVLWPAWKLWKQQIRHHENISFQGSTAHKSRRMHTHTPSRLRSRFAPALAICTSMFLTVATSYPPPPEPITNVRFCGERLAANELLLTFDPEQEWYKIDAAHPSQAGELELSDCTTSKTKVCTSDGSYCYRTIAEDEIEVSTDNGATWTLAWSGRSRQYFRHRLKYHRFSLFPSGPIAPTVTGPLALTIKGDVEAHSLLAAMGSEGLLLRDEQGSWSRHGALGNRAPKLVGNYGASSDSESLQLAIGKWPVILMPELSILAGLVYLLTLFTIKIRLRYHKGRSDTLEAQLLPFETGPGLKTGVTIVTGVMHGLLAVLIAGLTAFSIGVILPMIILPQLVIIIAAIRILQWAVRLFRSSEAGEMSQPISNRVDLLPRLWNGLSLYCLIYCLSAAPLVAWLYGWPERYEPALGLSGVVIALSLLIQLQWSRANTAKSADRN